MSILFLNGVEITSNAPALPILDRSYLFGEGLFETFRSYNGKIPFLDAHLDRFYKGARFLNIKAPTRPKIKCVIQTLLDRQTDPNAYIKLILSSQGSNIRLSKPQDATPNLLAYLENFKPYPKDLYKTGITATIIQTVRNDSPPLCWYKTTNYLSKVVARHEVERKGVWEGILLNPHGMLAEGSISNLFWVKDGVFHTPSLKAGCLPGVTRVVFLEGLKHAKILCREVEKDASELSDASEVFITNSLFEVLPVVAIDGRPVGKGKPGPFFKTMTKLYREGILSELKTL